MQIRSHWLMAFFFSHHDQCSAEMKRKYNDSQEDKLDLRAELTGGSRSSKASVARVLSILHKRGELVDDRLGADISKEEKALQRATIMHGNASTPYGTVIQGYKLTDDYVM